MWYLLLLFVVGIGTVVKLRRWCRTVPYINMRNDPDLALVEWVYQHSVTASKAKRLL